MARNVLGCRKEIVHKKQGAMQSLSQRAFGPTLKNRAYRLLCANTQTGTKDGQTYTFTVPSLEHYPFQWFWDSCFHAIAWTHFDVERAKKEIRSLLAWQEPSGFIPHVIFWDQDKFRRSLLHWHYWESKGTWTFLPWVPKPKTSAEMQPPVLAQAAERIFHASGDREFVKEILPRLEQYYRWVAHVRDPRNEGLISIIAPFEGGLDYSPAYDPAPGVCRLNPFNIAFRFRRVPIINKLGFTYDNAHILRDSTFTVKDVLVNSAFAYGLESLARLAVVAALRPPLPNFQEQSRAVVLANWARFKAHRIRKTLCEQCFDHEFGLFFNLTGSENTPRRVPTIISLMPLILPDLPQYYVDALIRHLVHPGEFATPFPVPSVARSDSNFTPTNRVGGKRFIWRGALSLNTSWFLIHGLRAHGKDGIAETIAGKTRRLVWQHGFSEFYNPLTGEPVGVPNFSWATLVIDL